MKLVARYIPLVLLAGFSIAILWWIKASAAPMAIEVRLPGADGAQQVDGGSATVDLSGTFSSGEGKPASLGTSPSQAVERWPGFRGQATDGVAGEARIDEKVIAAGPKWQLTIGEGYGGAAIWDGSVYLLDYDSQNRNDTLRCLSLSDGAEIWKRAYSVDVKRNHGMSRTVPAVSEKYVVTLGPKCHILCVDRASGEYKWGMDLVRRYRTKVPPWYAGQCPLIDNDRAIIAPGGNALMIAIDCATGEVLWETPNPRGWDMTHSSIIPMEFGGQRMYIYCGSGGVAGVDAETGKLLWETTEWRVKIANVPSPVPLGDDRILLSGGYDAGSMMIRLVPSGAGFEVQTVWRAKPQVLGSEQQTPIHYKGAIYAVIPGGQLACVDPASGKQLWNSGKTRFGIGPYLIAGDVIWLLSDDGKLSWAAADAAEFRLIGSMQAIENGHEAWGPMALAGGRLVLRDLTRLVCLAAKEVDHGN